MSKESWLERSRETLKRLRRMKSSLRMAILNIGHECSGDNMECLLRPECLRPFAVPTYISAACLTQEPPRQTGIFGIQPGNLSLDFQHASKVSPVARRIVDGLTRALRPEEKGNRQIPDLKPSSPVPSNL
jgi:hypothetical protein